MARKTFSRRVFKRFMSQAEIDTLEEDPEKVKQARRKWQNENKKHIRDYGKEYKQTPKAKYQKYKDNAKKRNYCFYLTFKQFVSFWQKSCYYCGSEIKTIGINRKDNNVGYILENCVPCCWSCNKFKRNKSTEHFIFMCKKIAKYQFTKIRSELPKVVMLTK